MKVLVVAPFDTKGRYKGGIHSIANSLINEKSLLCENELEIIPFDICRVQRKPGSEGKMNFSNIKNLIKGYFDIVKAVKSNKPDVLYFHTSKGFSMIKDLLILNHAKKRTGVKTVLHIHFADYEKIMTGKTSFDKFILTSLKKNVDRLVLLSTKTRDEFVSKGIERDTTHVVYNFSTLKFTNEEIQAKLTRNSSLRLLFVGSIGQRKGLFDILDVLKEIENDFEITVCGGFETKEDGLHFTEYEKLYGEKLKFLGYVDGEEKRRVFLDSDILLLPSYGEGLPIVIVEALTAGCAILASDVGAIPEIVTNNSGVLVAAGDKPKIKEMLDVYLDNKTLLREQQKFNFDNSIGYSIEHFIEHTANICRALVDEA